MSTQLLRLFTNCRIVKGYSRSVICDLQRGKIIYIPNSLTELFDDNNVINVEKIRSELDNESQLIFTDYLKLLNDYELVFPCSAEELDSFPELNLEYDYPATISNAIIDFDKNSLHNLSYIIDNFLIQTNCRHIQVRCFDEVHLDFLKILLTPVGDSFIKSIDIVIKYTSSISQSQITELVNNNKKVRTFTIHSSPINEVIQKENTNSFGVIVSTQQEITSETHCGIIQSGFFNASMETFTESLKYNSCLNKKLSIDSKGEIKNCPSMKESFGNIKDTELQQVIEHKDFKKYWKITKDQVTTCRDCEFRYVCTDCRAYLEDPKDIYSKPLKCGYDPYTNQWDKWSTNPLKQKVIEYYNTHSQ